MVEIANLAVIAFYSVASSRRRTHLWFLLAFASTSAILSLTRLRLLFGVALGEAVLMPHAILAALIFSGVAFAGGRYGREAVVLYLLLVSAVLSTLATTLGDASTRVDWALLSLLTFILPALIFYPASRLPHDEKDTLFEHVSTLAALSVTTGFVYYLAPDLALSHFPDLAGSGYRLVTIMGNPNIQAGVLLLVTPWLMNAFEADRSLLRGTLLMLALFGVLASGSRACTAVLVLYLVLHILTAFTFKAKGARGSRAAYLLVLALLLFIGAAVLSPYKPDVLTPLSRLAVAPEDHVRSIDLRGASLWTGFRLIQERPLFGYGPGQVYTWARSGGTTFAPASIIRLPEGISLVEPHNLAVLVGVEYGVPTLAAFAAFLCCLLCQRDRTRSPGRYTRKRAALAGVVLFGLQSVGSSDLAVFPQVGTLFWVWCGCCAAGVAQVDPALGAVGDSSRRDISPPPGR